MTSLDVDLTVRRDGAALRVRSDGRTLWVTPTNLGGLGLLWRAAREHRARALGLRTWLARAGLGLGLKLGPLPVVRLSAPPAPAR